MPLASGIRLGPYVIVGCIGQGGMGEVYRAKDPRLGREVAIKVLPRDFSAAEDRLRRFQLEARALASLAHPNVVQVFEVGEHEGAPYLVMELLEGETLRECLARGALPVNRALELAVQMAQALAAAHAKGLVHRDLKPANLFLTKGGPLKILDFGLAKQSAASSGDQSRAPTQDAQSFTSEGVAIGSVGYMSPEQVVGNPADARSDLFAFGVVFYEMLSGRRPFERGSAFETLSATLKEDPPRLASPSGAISSALKRLVTQCLEKDPARRFQGAKDLVLALQVVRDADPSAGQMKLPSRPRGTWAMTVRRRWPLAVAALAALGLATTLAWHPWRKDPARLTSVVALPAKVLGAPESAFLTDAIPDTLSTLLAGVDGIDTKCPPSSIELERVKGDTTKVAEAYGVDLLLLTMVTVQGEHLVLNARLVEPFTHKVRWASQLEGSLGTYNELIRQAAVGIARAMRPPGAPSAVLPRPTFRSEIELALREGRHLERRYATTWKEADFEAALAALQRAQSLDPTSATLAAEVGMLFSEKDVRVREPFPHQQARVWADRAMELDPHCGLAWTVRCWNEVCRPGRADPDKIAEYAFHAVAFSPGDVRGHLALGAMAPTTGMAAAAGWYVMEQDPLDESGYIMTGISLTDAGRAAEVVPLMKKALRLQLAEPWALNWTLSRALFKLGRNDEALKVYTPVWEAGLLGDLLKRDVSAARQRGIKLMAQWRGSEATAWYWANRAYIAGPLLVRAGLREEALELLQKAADSRGPMGLDMALLDPDLRQLKGDPRYHQALKAYRENALCFLRHAEAAEAQGNLPSYLKPSLAELKELVKRPI